MSVDHRAQATDRDSRHWQWRTTAGIALICAAGLTGCTTTLIVPPAVTTESATVFVVDHGRTTSLVVPSKDGTFIRYAYGDWQWYALGNQTVYRGIAAVLWPTQSGLGRGQLDGPGTVDSLRAQISSLVDAHAVTVEKARVLAFEQSMEVLYDSRRDTEVQNRTYGLSFVHHPRPYTWFWNSNHAVASWLRELGCETRGLSFGASWRVAMPQ